MYGASSQLDIRRRLSGRRKGYLSQLEEANAISVHQSLFNSLLGLRTTMKINCSPAPVRSGVELWKRGDWFLLSPITLSRSLFVLRPMSTYQEFVILSRPKPLSQVIGQIFEETKRRAGQEP
jgi:hypothetical protein